MDYSSAEQILKLKKYIEDCLEKGIKEKAIVSGLVEKGWPKDIIKAAVESLSQKTKKGPSSYTAMDFIKEAAVIISNDTPILKAIQKIREKGYVLIYDKEKPAGILTSDNLVELFSGTGKFNLGLPVSSLTLSPITSCKAEDNVLTICSCMENSGLSYLPVMKNNKIVGVISSKEIIRFVGFG